MQRQKPRVNYHLDNLVITSDPEHSGRLLISHEKPVVNMHRFVDALYRRIPKEIFCLEIVDKSIRLSYINKNNESADANAAILKEVLSQFLQAKTQDRITLRERILSSEITEWAKPFSANIDTAYIEDSRNSSFQSAFPVSVQSDETNTNNLTSFFQPNEISKRKISEIEHINNLNIQEQIEYNISTEKELIQILSGSMASLTDLRMTILKNLALTAPIKTILVNQLRESSKCLHELQRQQENLQQEKDTKIKTRQIFVLDEYMKCYLMLREQTISLEEINEEMNSDYVINLVIEEKNKILDEYSQTERIINDRILQFQNAIKTYTSTVISSEQQERNYYYELYNLENKLQQDQKTMTMYENHLEELNHELDRVKKHPRQNF